MDSAANIETYTKGLRYKYRAGSATPDKVGLRRFIDALMAEGGEASETVAITSQSFESGQATGQLVLTALEKLDAALAVLAEIDPDNAVPDRPNYAYARFGQGVAALRSWFE